MNHNKQYKYKGHGENDGHICIMALLRFCSIHFYSITISQEPSILLLLSHSVLLSFPIILLFILILLLFCMLLLFCIWFMSSISSRDLFMILLIMIAIVYIVSFTIISIISFIISIIFWLPAYFDVIGFCWSIELWFVIAMMIMMILRMVMSNRLILD